uniref:uncharacterized protein LOC114600099 n=1 Tax=Podarcis muralis TaxID=64176 RepID=UPI00109F022A|nr:uncharacterized protein LOC114600099 [Podarcis muralis]
MLNCTVSEVTVMNLKPDKKTTVILPGKKKEKVLRSASFHHSAPNLADTTVIKEETKTLARKVTKDSVPFPKPFYSADAQSMDNLAMKRPVRLAPLEISLEVKEAQLKKIMSLQRDSQLAASKLASIGSIGSEPHVKRVKNLAQVEVESLHMVKPNEKPTLENQEGSHSSSFDNPLCKVQIILPAEGNAKPSKKPVAECSPVRCRKPLIPKNMCDILQTPDFQEDAKIPDNPSQVNGRPRFKLKQMKEQQERLGKAKPLKATGTVLEEGKVQTASQRAQKTLSHANKLLDNVAKKHRGRGEEPDEIDEDLLAMRAASRRIALGDIILVDEE